MPPDWHVLSYLTSQSSPVALPAQLSSLFSLCPSQAAIYWFSTKTWESRQENTYIAKSSPEQAIFTFMPQLRTTALSKGTNNYLTLSVSSISTPLVHIISLVEIFICQNPTQKTYFNFFTEKFDKIWQRWGWHTFNLVILFSGKYPRNTFAYEHKEISAKIIFVSVSKRSRDYKQPKCPSTEELILKLCTHTYTLEYYATVNIN